MSRSKSIVLVQFMLLFSSIAVPFSSSGQPTFDRISRFLVQLDTVSHKIDGIYISQDGELVTEAYFNGYEKETPHDLRSVTKSIRAILVGIAIDQGLIKTIDDSIWEYLEDVRPTKNEDPRKDKITIKHLLTMSTGLECNDWDPKSKGQEDKVYKKKEWIQYTVNLPMVNEPGTVSMYCSMCSVILAKIIEETSGMDIMSFAEKNLLNPLGIKKVEWTHTNKSNVVSAGKRIHLNPSDMAKIGQLLLDSGKYQGKEIVSSVWIQDMTSEQKAITGIPYGYSWWSIPLKAGNQIYSSTIATGNGGQYIMIVPELTLVAVFTGSAYNSDDDKLPFTIMQEVVLPEISN